MPNILVIEDDPKTAREIIETLKAHGFEVEWQESGKDGLSRGLIGGFDLITLDRLLPEMEGLEILQALRREGVKTPVLVLTALGDVDERIRGLRAGGDDYLSKPFSLAELTARVDALLRRQRMEMAVTILCVADLKMDLVRREVHRGTRKVELLPREFQLLEFLMRHGGEIITRRMLFEAVWEYHFNPHTNVIEVQIGRLRKKIGDGRKRNLIRTIRGVGYVLQAS